MAGVREGRVSRRSDLILGAATLAVFIVVAMLGSLEKALACSIVFGVFLSIIQTKWESQVDRRFWFIIIGLALVHVAALWLIHIPELQFGLVSLPFALVDAFAMWGLINWVERRFPAKNGRPSE
jgi:hypothetical protein